MADKNNVIVGKDRNNIEGNAKSPSNTEATSYKIPSTKLKQNSHSKWMMFSATLRGSMEAPPVNSESRGIAMFGAIDDTLHFRIEAKNIHDDTGAQLCLGKQGKNDNVIADLVEPGKHASTTQGTIIKGSITDSSLSGPLEGQSINTLIKLIEEEKVSVNLYLSSRHREIRGIIHRAGRARFDSSVIKNPTSRPSQMQNNSLEISFGIEQNLYIFLVYVIELQRFFLLDSDTRTAINIIQCNTSVIV